MAEKSILGIDLRVCSVKVVELRKGSRGYILTGWGMEDVPFDLVDKHPEKEVAQAKVIQKILAVNRIRTREAVVVVGGGDVVVRQISMPPVSYAEAKEAIKWKMKDEITYPLEEAVVDFIPVSKPVPGKAEIDYLAAVAHKSTINYTLEIARLAGLRLAAVIPVPLALKELYGKQLVKGGVTSLIYMGRRTTNISFLKDEKLQLNREVPLGGEDITRAMTSLMVSEEGRLELKYEEAEKIKKEYGIPIDLTTYPKLGDIPISHLQAVMRPALEKMEDEILRTVEYYRGIAGEAVFQKVIMTGGASNTPHLLEFLKMGLDMPFETVDSLSDIIVDAKVREKGALTLAAAQLAAALGAAESSYTKGLNLLPEEIREKWRILVRKHFNPIETSIALVLLMVLVYLYMLWQSSALRTEIAIVKKKIDNLKPRLARLEEMEKARREEEGRKGIFQTIESTRIKIPVVMEEVSLNLPAAVILNSISIVEASRQVRLSGTVFGKGDSPENILSRFIIDLSAAPSFDKVELISATKAENFAYPAFSFEIVGVARKK
jgi:type IV pilus assembly protein PilM